MDVNELFQEMENNNVSLNTIDETVYCTLDEQNREIILPSEYQIIGVESDEKVERLKFQFPKIVGDNIDLSQLSIRINYKNANGEIDQNIAENISSDDENIYFDWLLTRKVTKYKGTVNFIVCAIKTNNDGTITNEWNTTIAGSTVLEGLEPEPVTEEEKEQARDLLTQLLSVMLSVKTDSVQAVNDTKDNAITEITEVKDEYLQTALTTKDTYIADIQRTGNEEKDKVTAEGTRVLDTIPQDYQALNTLADNLNRHRATGIVQSASGEVPVIVNDSSDLHVVDLGMDGKTEQTVTDGYQLFDASKLPSKNNDYITITNNNDGSFTSSGTGTVLSGLNISYNISHDELIKIFKEGNITLKAEGSSECLCAEFVLLKNESSYIDIITSSEPIVTSNITKEMLDDVNSSAIIRVRSLIGSTAKTGTIKPMLYQDGDGTWEPYSGGYASPSPEWKQDIISAGKYNEETQKYEYGIFVTNSNFLKNDYFSSILVVGSKPTNFSPVDATELKYATINTELPKGKYVLSCKDNFYMTVNRVYINGEKTFEIGKRMPYEFEITKSGIVAFSVERDESSSSITDIYLGYNLPSGLGIKISPKEIYQYQYEQSKFSKITLTSDRPLSKWDKLVKKDGKWMWEFNSNKIIFDGNETYTDTYFPNVIVNTEQLQNKPGARDDYNLANMMCNYSTKEYNFANPSNNSFQFSNAESYWGFSSADDAKEWITQKYQEGNPFMILYQTAEPEYVELESDQQAALNNLATYYKTTVLSNDQYCNMSLDYIADTKTYIDDKIAMIAKQIIDSVGGVENV